MKSTSVDLVVTSPPYPMIEMWDEMFSRQDPTIQRSLEAGNGQAAFDSMHRLLDPVWEQLCRVLRNGGVACINIGDATRTVGGDFRLFANHARILHRLTDLGLQSLPDILWRKQTNSPSKFMGSGMLPAGAYVTLEHEYILILRKSGRRQFVTDAEKQNRRESALFWEERNCWYSDVWLDLKGTGQRLTGTGSRSRSAAFPFELAHRLVSMYSVKQDTVLDPFLGSGTTTFACMAAGRHSLGFELDPALLVELHETATRFGPFARERLTRRLQSHREFVQRRVVENGPLKYLNHNHQFAVVTGQETDILLQQVDAVERIEEGVYEVCYAAAPTTE